MIVDVSEREEQLGSRKSEVVFWGSTSISSLGSNIRGFGIHCSTRFLCSSFIWSPNSEVPLTDRDSTIVAADEIIFSADCTQSSRWCMIIVSEFSTPSTSVSVSPDVEFNLVR